MVSKKIRMACLLSMSRIPDDPRVRRQGDALAGVGWDVCGVGQPGALSAQPHWPCYDITSPRCSSAEAIGAYPNQLVKPGSYYQKILDNLPSFIRSFLMRAAYAVRSQLAHVSTDIALSTYWSWPSVQEIYNAASGIHAELWVANDWNTLPIAARLASERGGVFVYDTHEFAINEYAERLKWRLFNRPIVKKVENEFIREARNVSTVSEGIADGIFAFYDLADRPLVVRNTPNYQAIKSSPEGESVRVLYHGLVAPTRGLEPLIRSVKYWRPEFTLTIRGPGNKAYIDVLNKLIIQEGGTGRIEIAPAVPMTELVQEASLFDIGFFCMPCLSKQHEYVLPNKLFEYIMAGLAVCVSDLPEMSRIVNSKGVGVLLPSESEADIASTINSLMREDIRLFKARSLEAARELCWEEESKRMLEAYAQVVDSN